MILIFVQCGSTMRETFQAFWHGPPLNMCHWACLQSFLGLGHELHLYTYGSRPVPEGVVLRDANEILPESELFYFQNPNSHQYDLGPFSDLFRFKLLLDRGGWYVDLDTICLSATFPKIERAWSRELPEVYPDAVAPGQIAFPKGDPVVAELYRRCREKSRNYERREELGPELISAVIRDFTLPLDCGGSPDTFYP